MTDVAELRNRLLGAFPPQPFFGLISTHDECDEGIALRRELPNRSWEDVSSVFVKDNSSSLGLLEPDALKAFLPAWLLSSMKTFDRNNLVLEFTVYFLCPGDEDEGWDEDRIARRVGRFNAVQRNVVADFFRAILENDELYLYHPYAKQGLTRWSV